MSLNIQTSTGLLEISTKVTKEKVISALGYEPADKAHTEDKTVHVTSAEKETWNNKSDVKHYEDLEGAPNIAENDSGSMIVADESGNIIMQVDADGVSTTNVDTKTIKLDGKDLGERLDELEAISLPNILDNETGDLTISDESGNAIMKIDASGLETTTVTAKSAVISGVDIVSKLDEHKEAIDDVSGDLITHTSNSTVHITADERTLWNNKSDFSGDYNDLTNAPDIKEDNSGEVVYADEAGNVIAKIGENGFETTQVIADIVVAGGVNVGSTLSSHTGNTDIHITAAERTAWNAKADTTYVDTKVASLVNSAPSTLDTLNELAAALGDDPNFATTVATQIGLKVDKTTFDAHTHTKVDVGLGNVDNTSDANKPVSTAQREALNELKSELSESIVSESKEWTIADNDGNVIAKVDANGLETTTVTVDAVVLNGIDLQATLDGKSNAGHTHSQYLEADDIVNKADITYVDEEIGSAIAEAKTDASNKDAVVLFEAQRYASAVQTTLDTHTDNTDIHITDAERTAWNNKSDFSGDYNDLTNAPNITENNSGDLIIADNDGNIIFRSDGAGFETTTLTAQTVVVNGIDVETTLDNKANKATTLSGYGITDAASKTHAHAISDVTNLQAALDGKADSGHTHDEYLVASDISDFVTETYVNTEIAKKADAEHTHDNYLEASDISGKADKTYVDSELAKKADAIHTHNEYLVESDISDKADISYVDSEVSKKADVNHAHDNYLTADSIAGKADTSYVDEQLAIAIESANTEASNKDAVVLFETQKSINAVRTYVDDELVKKADSTHTHEEYLVAGDIANKADKTELHEHLNKTELDKITSGKVDAWDAKASKTYVDEQLATKANSSHYHTLTDVSDITATATELNYMKGVSSGVQLQLDGKANKATTLEGYGITDAASKTYVDQLIDGLTTEGTADAALVQAALTAHTNDKANPHGVTLGQLGVNATAIELSYVSGITSNIQNQINSKANATHTHEQYLTANDITGKADKTYVDNEVDAAKTDASNKDAVILFEAQKGISAVQSSFNTHAENMDVHITSTERASWNGKADKSYVDDELAKKANKSELHSHSNKAELDKIVDGKVEYWDAKSDFSGDYNDLTNAPDIKENASGEVVYADEAGNIVAAFDANGLRVTTVVLGDTEDTLIDLMNIDYDNLFAFDVNEIINGESLPVSLANDELLLTDSEGDYIVVEKGE